MPLQLELMPVEEKLPDTPPPKTIVVRYGYLREIGEFASDLTQKVGCGTKLILRTDRGTEIGEMLTTTCGNGGCNKSITREKMLAYIENSGGRDYPFSEQGRVLRAATTQDLAEQVKLDEQKHKHLTLAREMVGQHKLAMKVVDVEHLLGGERILFYFVSEQRVDFRMLVRDLAHALHTRIELRQIGARDEARLVADYEKCGQHCCCKQFLKVLTPISMRAAKVQKATLDPTKISGRCGRLMCCLRYEDETYEELRKKLPKRNSRVETEKGDAWVIDGQILTQLVLVQFDDGKREAVPMEKIMGFDRPKPVMADGRTMQTPNDRPPPPPGGMVEGAGPAGMRGRPPRGPQRAGGAGGGPGTLSGKQQRPQPGAPVGPSGAGDPLARTGPTGGDLNAGAGDDDLADLIADAYDGAPPASAAPAAPPSPTETPKPPMPAPQRMVKHPPTSAPPRPAGGAAPRGFRPPRRETPPKSPTTPPSPSSPEASVEGVPPPGSEAKPATSEGAPGGSAEPPPAPPPA
ncbi:MAG TPA: regulatory iron-sulfur-containing complex subunit RicT [Phycisphaerae bacterium]|nr:regulatory iron-sulfur-containing complex subunit RicT [Phycisphaerae bacterium]